VSEHPEVEDLPRPFGIREYANELAIAAVPGWFERGDDGTINTRGVDGYDDLGLGFVQPDWEERLAFVWGHERLL
jgi:hypothetical protein